MKLIALLLLPLCATAAIAAPPTQESVETLLRETRIERSIDSMMNSIRQLTQQNIARAMASTPMTVEAQHAMQASQEKITALLQSEMTWQNLEPIYVEVYRQTYTQEEVDGLTAFYRTPVGQSYIDKMPQALQRSITAMQPLLKDVLQKAQVIGQEAAEAARSTKKSEP